MALVQLNFFPFLAGLNLSSTQPQPGLPDNRTIQNFVRSYVDEYTGGYILQKRLINLSFKWFYERCCWSLMFFSLIIYEISSVPILFVLFEAGVNLSLTQPQPKLPDNRTIQNLVENYVNKYVGKNTVLVLIHHMHWLS